MIWGHPYFRKPPHVAWWLISCWIPSGSRNLSQSLTSATADCYGPTKTLGVGHGGFNVSPSHSWNYVTCSQWFSDCPSWFVVSICFDVSGDMTDMMSSQRSIRKSWGDGVECPLSIPLPGLSLEKMRTPPWENHELSTTVPETWNFKLKVYDMYGTIW